jgi:capsular exopolysaccharide synthesis family protein
VPSGVENVRVFPRSRPPRAVVDPTTASAEAFRTLRLALQIRADGRTGNSFLFTSAEPGAGKSTVAANYALIASMRQRVLLIDADLKRPALHKFFAVDQAPGLVDLLAGTPFDEGIRHVGPGALELVPAGSSISHVSDVTASERMGELLRTAAASYDLVVLDAPPVLASADAEGLASHDGVTVVLVVRPSTKRRLITKALRRLELIDANVAGIVVNRLARVSPYAY